MSNRVKTRRHPNGIWIIPQEQLEEFNRPGGPDYRSLIEDCIRPKIHPIVKYENFVGKKARKLLK